MANEIKSIHSNPRDLIPPRFTTQQIGRMGELLVQYELLSQGIDSARMTTDSGIDLVAYSGVKGRSFTIQVKTNLTPKPGGGKGAGDRLVGERGLSCGVLCICRSFNSTSMAFDQTGTCNLRPTAIRRTVAHLYVHKRRIRISRLLTAW
jgi:hypothetical protein